MIEKGPSHVGVIFTPKLGDQRVEWALGVLRREEVGSVLDVGCGEGRLLEVLCRPASGIKEEPIERGVGGGGDEESSNVHPSSSSNGAGRLKRQRSETNTPGSVDHDRSGHGHGPGPGSSSTHGQSEEQEDSMMLDTSTSERNGRSQDHEHQREHGQGQDLNGSTTGTRKSTSRTRTGSVGKDDGGVIHDLFIHVSSSRTYRDCRRYVEVVRVFPIPGWRQTERTHELIRCGLVS